MPKEKTASIRGKILIGLFVALIFILLNWLNSFMPLTLSKDWVYAIDVLIMLVLIIAFVNVRKK